MCGAKLYFATKCCLQPKKISTPMKDITFDFHHRDYGPLTLERWGGGGGGGGGHARLLSSII